MMYGIITTVQIHKLNKGYVIKTVESGEKFERAYSKWSEVCEFMCSRIEAQSTSTEEDISQER